MPKNEPYIKGTGKITNDKGEVIGTFTYAYNNPDFTFTVTTDYEEKKEQT